MHNLDPLHAQLTVEFILLRESNDMADETGGGAQLIMLVMLLVGS